MALPVSSQRFRELRLDPGVGYPARGTCGEGENGPPGVKKNAEEEIFAEAESNTKVQTKGVPSGPYRASSHPIDMFQNGAPVLSMDNTGTLQRSPPSTGEDFLLNRRTSISFNPQITLDSGDTQHMDEPLQRPFKARQRGRSVLQAISDEKARAARAHSESDCTQYDPRTGRPIPQYESERPGDRQLAHIGELRHPLLSSTVDDLARESMTDLSNSMTSQSTSSAVFSEEVHTPHDEQNQDFILSPSALSPLHSHTSFEESPWNRPNLRHSADRSQPVDFFNRAASGSLRKTTHQSSRQNTRRSTSSSTKSPASAASSFLRGFSVTSSRGEGGERSRPSSPDAEGQTIGDDYVLGKQIGYGGLSVIREAYQMQEGAGRGTQRKLAVKIVRKSLVGKIEAENEAAQAEFEHEVELWRFLNHAHILPLEAVYKTDEATFCFIPLNVGGTLFDLVRANRSGVPINLAKRYTYQLASALRYLHQDARVVHRDVKLENCLLDTSALGGVDVGTLRLCDFGMAEWISSNDSSGSGPPSPRINSADRPPQKSIGPSDTSTSAFAGGSLEYAAPEILQVLESPNPERMMVRPTVDIWALGVCIYAMVVGSRPFSNAFQPRVMMAILAGDWDRDRLEEKAGEDVLKLVNGCMQMDVRERWDINDVLRCAWLREESQKDEETNTNKYSRRWML